MKLYQIPLSPNCQKVIALAREVGVPRTLVPIEVLNFMSAGAHAAFFAAGLAPRLASD